MTEFKRETVKIVTEDVKQILAEAVDDYQTRTGKTLQPAHIEQSLIQTYAYRELLVRKGINEAFLQTFPQFATGVALDLCGEPMGCYRNDGEDDDTYRKRVLLAPEAFTTCGTKGSYEYHTRAVSPTICDVHISTPQGGTVQIVLLTTTGVPSSELLTQVRNYVSSEERRTLCDTVQVVPCVERKYQIEAVLDLLTTADEITTLAKARQALESYLATRTQQMGLDIVPLNIQSALKVAGVYNVTLVQPTLTQINVGEWANCTQIQITAKGVRQDG